AREARWQALWLNSSATLAFFLLHQSDALVGGFSRLKKSDWDRFYLLDVDKLDQTDKRSLEEAWQKLSRVQWKPIREQLAGDSDRARLDSVVLRVLGLNNDEIGGLLPRLYKGLL